MTVRRIRVIDLETAGDATTDVCEIGWQDVVSVDGDAWQLDQERGARFVNPGRPITAETMAVHHILDEWVAGAPFWKEMAAEVLQPQGGVMALAAHRAAFEQRYCTPRLTGSANWICTWKGALRMWPELQGFSNQMLRYQRKPQGLIHEHGLPAHRAMPDAYVTAHHLRDMLNVVGPEQLIDWSRQPGLLPRVRSGPDRGKPWPIVEAPSLEELARDRDIDTRFSAEAEIRRRGGLVEPIPTSAKQQELF
ncbi:exonuclease [Devosia soli]|uniref:Exonuclease n=1 Tax=Devosia soli TaxID=361041 RepID=A0A0F5L445_9HYPH|nr:DNA polymerase III subunit epsilon [Devosia soli]KKB76984.1 exonuclease [Devosia soli]